MSQRRYIVSQHLIAANIERISAVSWHGYQKQGRGVVLIDGEVTDTKQMQLGPLVFVSDTEAQETRGGWPSQEVAGLVKVYDPECEVIVVIRWQNGVGAYRFKPATPPPAAYASFKEMLR